MTLTKLEQAILYVLELEGVDYVGPTFVYWAMKGQLLASRDLDNETRGDRIDRVGRALQSLVKKGLADHPAHGKYAANPRSVSDFMATLKPWDCVKVRGEWHFYEDGDKLLLNGDGQFFDPDGWNECNDREKVIHLHEIDTADIRNVKPGGATK